MEQDLVTSLDARQLLPFSGMLMHAINLQVQQGHNVNDLQDVQGKH